MATSFGKYLRKLRIDRGEVLSDMAKKLEVTSSYLSAIENGKRKIPENWIDEISGLYQVDINELQEKVDQSVSELKISLGNKTSNDKELMFAFARNFDKLDEVKKKELQSILESVMKGDN